MSPVKYTTIGILGGGQLAKFLAIEANKLGFQTSIYCDNKDSPAFNVGSSFTLADYNDDKTLAKFAKKCDIITCEFENIPYETLRQASLCTPVRPNPNVFATTQNRFLEKTWLKEHNIPTTTFYPLRNNTDLNDLKSLEKYPYLLKTCTGYDGKGQAKVTNYDELTMTWINTNKADCIIEEIIDFDLELSIIACREQNGTIAHYDPIKNIHENGILRKSIVPLIYNRSILGKAVNITTQILNEMNYIGTIGVEFFLLPMGKVLVNEIAPRVHNSGHWTMDACRTNQFEQHIRAISGHFPLMDTRRQFSIEMTNIVGEEIHTLGHLVQEKDIKIYLYGKNSANPNRKMGHYTRAIRV